MLGINRVILVGNLGKDPELRYTPGGSAVASFPLATTERFKGRDGNRQEKTEWHNIVVWNKQAEVVNQYLKKGRMAYIEGKIRSRSWEDRDGNKRYTTEIIADRVQFLGSRDGGGGGGRSAPPPPSPSAVNESADLPPADDSGPEDDLPF